MKKLAYFSLTAFLFIFVLEQRGVFIPEVALAATCKPFTSFESGQEQNRLIELYTSEGCSSCPPAEKWVNSLYSKPGLYEDFVPLAFHVDYWDYIGHKDPMAKPQYTQRQRSYASQWSAPNIYTPGFVLDGKEWRSLRRNAPKGKSKKVGNITVSKSDKGYEVSFSKKGNYRMYGALLVHGVENKIRRGENSGRTLKHNFVVNELIGKKAKNSKASFTFEKPTIGHKEQALAFWVTSLDSLEPIQVAGHCL